MRFYTVHLPRGAPPAEAVLVKEGFCWPALFLAPIWSLWHGLVRMTCVWLVAMAALGVAMALLPAFVDSLSVLGWAIFVLFGAEGNDARRRALAREGWREVAVVGGSERDAAARRFIDLALIRAHHRTT
jgi:hypothetical protein